MSEMSVPKIIMQTWKTNTLPEKWQESQDSILNKMSGWKYVLMTDEDNRKFVLQYFPEFIQIYDNLPYPIQRVDMIRPMWLYINGGVYMDLDYVVNKPFDELFSSENSLNSLYFVQSSNTSIYFTNSFMASTKNHPFWLEYLNYMKNDPPFWAITKHFIVMTTTGPIALTNALSQTKWVYSVLPQKQLIPCDVCDIGKCRGGFLKTIEGQSWNGVDSLALNYLYCNWTTVLITVLIVIILYSSS